MDAVCNAPSNVEKGTLVDQDFQETLVKRYEQSL